MSLSLVIASKDNAHFKNWLRIRRGKGDKPSHYVLEGLRLCRDALVSGLGDHIEGAAFSESGLEKPEIAELAQRLEATEGLGYTVFSDVLFGRLCDTVHPQGVLFLLRPPEPKPLAEASRVLVLEDVQDPGNLGAIWRSADAFGFDLVCLTKRAISPNNPKALRAAMGAIFHVPVLVFESIQEAYKALAEAGFLRIATTLDGLSFAEWERPPVEQKLALMIGNEGKGLSPYAVEAADVRLTIPMAGRAESLNAACAATILCYELGV